MERYRPIKQIGKGSFGNALLVHPTLQPSKYFVMKIIDISKLDRKQKEEAVNEVHVLKALRHPYIVAYRESFVEKQCLCIVMDYADGGDLQSQINKQKQKGGSFTEEQILDWFVQICLALKHIHDRQILHRDIKAQNIFLTSKNVVKLGDFGIARVLRDQQDYARTAIGTPYYLSPEICEGKPYNQKSDIWSLGCILYQMIMLKHAFDGNTIKDLMKKIMTEKYTPIPSKFSNELAELVSEMLTKDPNQRPTINEVLQKKFLNGRISSFIQEAVTPTTPKSGGLDLRSSSTKKTLFKNSSEKELHSKRNDSYSLYKASFHSPKETYFSPRLPTKHQPSQSQEGFETLGQSQVEHSDYFPDIASIPNLRQNGHSKPIFSLQLKVQTQQDQTLVTPRTGKQVGPEDRSRNHLKDRPKSYEKYYVKSPGLAKQTIDTSYYSSVQEINNVVAENLSFINNIKAAPRGNASFLSQGGKESPSCKIDDPRKIISSMLSPREDNQTPEGDLIDFLQVLGENDVKKEIGNTDLGIKEKIVSETSQKGVKKRLEKMTRDMWRVGDENALEFEGMWALLEEKLGTRQLEKAYGYIKLNKGKIADTQSLMKVIGEKNQRYIKDLEKLMHLKKRQEEY